VKHSQSGAAVNAATVEQTPTSDAARGAPAAAPVPPSTLESTEAMLYAWGEECRSKSDDLGLPTSSGMARLIEQRHVYERHLRGARRRRAVERRLRQPMQLTDGRIAIVCACGIIHLHDTECPRCKGDPRPPDRSVHGAATRSFRPQAVTEISGQAVLVDSVVASAPNWMRKVLMFTFLYVERDTRAAERLRVRVSTYREQRAAAVEFVAGRLANARSPAL
jgi:hypothetical protein